MVHGQFESFSGLEVVEIVKRFCIEEDAEAVCLSHFAATTDELVGLEQLGPEGQVVQSLVEAQLRLDDGTK